MTFVILKRILQNIAKQWIDRVKGLTQFLRYTLRAGYEEKTAVVFVAERARHHFRLLRIAKWLHRIGQIDLILVSKDVGGDFDLEVAYRKIFRSFYKFDGLWQLRGFLKGPLRNPGLIFHILSPPSDFARWVIQTASGRCYYDPYDVRVIYFGPDGEGCDIPWMRRKWIQRDIPDERFCLEHAAGLICRSAETKLAIRKFGYHANVPRLFFTDYCDPDVFEAIKPFNGSFNKQSIHIVYVGGVASRKAPKSFYGYLQFHNSIQTITDQCIHFHIYPSPTQDDDLSDYVELASRNPYFHWHDAVPQSLMITELKKYDFGIIPFFVEEMGNLSTDKFRASTSLKLFNYLEAGIPVIVSRDLEHKSQIVRRYGIGICIGRTDLPHLSNILHNVDYSLLLSCVDKARSRLGLERHINRLLEFYGINNL